ncbi:MAG: SGNH/GDSL hydrolase family protein [Clostridia bacterium]|nr:SGNH/GDSL hydrolase family protein [Clostridia bacterium]
MNYAENGKSNTAFTCNREKKNIFLIGDSIRQGYCETVKTELADIAETFYVSDNCRNTQYVITSLEGWKNKLDDADLIDLVQFNCGHWDVARWGGGEKPLTSESEYAKNIKMLIDLIRAKFVNAKVVFATTTTMSPDNVVSPNPRDNRIIDTYNEIAVKVAKENGVFINDLNKVTRNWGTECYQDYCHFTEEAATLLGKAVAAGIRKIL